MECIKVIVEVNINMSLCNNTFLHMPQVFMISKDPKPGLEGHIFPNPVDTGSYMVMLVYKSGSLTREGTDLVLYCVVYLLNPT